MRLLRVMAALLLASAPLAAGAEDAAQAAPQRVVSINLCTDQLAMLLAGEGQLLSVSFVAADPRSSAMAEAARALPLNHGLAEEIYLLQPDLVLASRFSARATVDMLRRLGIPVAEFEPASSLDDVRGRLFQMGDVLGQEAAAEAQVAHFDRHLAALRDATGDRPSAALYYANGYTAGDRSLAGQILLAAGFDNAAVAAGFAAGGILPLEVLAMAEPDALITSRAYPGASRSEEILRHPVVEALRRDRAGGTLADGDWVCGTPHVLRAVDAMGALRRSMAGE